MIFARLVSPALVLLSAWAPAEAFPVPAHKESATHPPERAVAALAHANENALVGPSASGFVNAVQIYPWSEGTVYRVDAAPGLISDVALQPGEGLNSVAAGDTVRWIIGETSSGAGPMRRTHILIKPTLDGLRTNAVITTDRRVYLLLLQSRRGPAMAAVAWSYPLDELVALKHAREAAPIAGGINVDQLDFDYSIAGDMPPWRPLRAFDDGNQVFIEFPLNIATGEVPPLFVIGSSGRGELVNYRQQGRYFVVDQLFSRAELRLGEKHQQVVWIVRSRALGQGH